MKKKQVKALMELSKALPPSKEIQIYSVAVQGYDVPLDIKEKQTINDEDWYKSRNYRVVDINHHNRLKSAFSRDKEQGLIDYINWVAINNYRMNQLMPELKLKGLDKNLQQVVRMGKDNFWSNIIRFLYAFYHTFIKKDEKVVND